MKPLHSIFSLTLFLLISSLSVNSFAQKIYLDPSQKAASENTLNLTLLSMEIYDAENFGEMIRGTGDVVVKARPDHEFILIEMAFENTGETPVRINSSQLFYLLDEDKKRYNFDSQHMMGSKILYMKKRRQQGKSDVVPNLYTLNPGEKTEGFMRFEIWKDQKLTLQAYPQYGSGLAQAKSWEVKSFKLEEKPNVRFP